MHLYMHVYANICVYVYIIFNYYKLYLKIFNTCLSLFENKLVFLKSCKILSQPFELIPKQLVIDCVWAGKHKLHHNHFSLPEIEWLVSSEENAVTVIKN